MISFLIGEVKSSDGINLIVLTSNGVGYELNYSYFAEVGQKIEIYCSMIIRENNHQLFGFNSYSDKKLFELLLDVNGVGPKSAYSLVVNIGFDKIQNAIQFDQKNLLTEAPGIGKKTAEQIILSLREKINKFIPMEIKSKNSNKENHTNTKLINETIMALEGLGYKPSEVMSSLKGIYKDGMTSEDLLKQVLKEL